jgi:phosphoribosylformylglycinamidine cyclo-ligase
MVITYKQSGVDIVKGNKLVDMIKPAVRSTFRREVLADIGSFNALFKIDTSHYKNPVLVSSTDGVGTKLKIAFMLKKHSTVGIDLVAMCVNDILTSGAEPLFFLDYFSTGKLSTQTAAEVIKGIAHGCTMSGCSLIGGETAEMPGMYARGEYDLAGFSVGIVEKSKIINGSNIKKGDIVIGLASNGLHSNGYSLVRKLFFDMKRYKPKQLKRELGCTLGHELLKPTKIYVNSILKILPHFKIKGMAHITGGGITENMPRLFRKSAGLGAVIKKESWPVNKIFDIIQTTGNISDREMYRTFNMGIGYIIVTAKPHASGVLKSLRSSGEKAYVIGYIEKGKGKVIYK